MFAQNAQNSSSYDIQSRANSGFSFRDVCFFLPIPLLLGLLCVMASDDVEKTFESYTLLLVLNGFFLSFLPLIVAYFAMRAYIRTGYVSLIMLGAGTLSLGFGSLLSALSPFLGGGPNTIVTIHNTSALCSGLFNLVAAVTALRREQKPSAFRHRVIYAALSCSFITFFLVLLLLGTIHGLTPTFFVQNVGPTYLRQVILGAAIGCFSISAALLAAVFAISRSRFLGWYWMALALIATGLLCVFVQKSVGSDVGWVGRVAQYIGGGYFLVAVLTAWRELRQRNLDLVTNMWTFFFNNLELAVSERTAELKESRDRFQDLVENTGDWVWEVDEKGVYTYVSPKVRDVLGFEPQEILNKTPFDFMDTEEAHRVLNVFSAIAISRKPFTGLENTNFHKDGHRVILETNAVPFFSSDGALKGYRGIDRDITDRKWIQEAVRESRENLSTLFETMDDIIIVGAQDGKIQHANAAALRKLGYTPDELITMHVLDLNPKSQRQEAERILSEMFKGERISCPLPLEKKDGTVIPTETRVWFGKWSGIDCIFAVCKDLSREQEALQKFNKFFELNPTPMEVSSLPERKLMEVNESWLATMGFSRNEVIGKTTADLLVWVDPEKQQEFANRLQEQGSVRNIELRVRKKDGTILEGIFSGTVIDSQGRNYFISAMLDVTKRKRAEEELAERQAILQGLLDSIPDIIFFKDINGVYLGCNAQLASYVGSESQAIIGHTDYDLFNKDVADSFRENDHIMMEQMVVRHNEEWIDYPDGRRRLVDTCKAPLRLPNGAIIGLLGVARDITEIKNAEDALRESEAKYRLLADNTQDVIWQMDIDLRFTYVNPSIFQLTGHTADEWVGTRLEEHFDRETFIKLSQAVSTAISKGYDDPEIFVEAVLLNKNREPLPIEVLAKVLYAENGLPIALQGVTRDITERKDAEKALLESEQRYRSLFEGSRDGIVFSDMEGRIRAFNTTYREMLGYTTEELFSKTYKDLTPAQWMAMEDRIVSEQIIPRGFSDIYEKEYICKDGRVIPVELNIFIVVKDGENVGMWAVARDITKRKRLEQERLEMERKLLHAQKLESLGVMAGGIAHDFNNLLQVVLGNLDIALDDIPPDSEARQSILNAIKASERSAELSGQMLVYSGSAIYLPVDIHLDDLLNQTTTLLQPSVSQNVSFNFDICKTLPPIKGEPNQIQRLIYNLVVNAYEAIGVNAGAITLRTGVMDCDEAYLRRSRLDKNPESGRFVFLEVSDTGCGMDIGTQHKLFDPFFTTKFYGRGLGMAEVMGIVKGHHGAIIVDSEVGKGTTIRVLFPAHQAALTSTFEVIQAIETQPAVSANPTGRKTILVVDDEDLVRSLVTRRLAVLGYLTITASDGDEGVRVFRDRQNEIDLVLLDFAMPKMNGVEAFGELIRIKPDVKVILSSGYTEDVVMQSFPGQRPAGVLHKPYKMEALKGELDRLLGAGN